MRNIALTILILSVVAIILQSCDSTLNIDKPKDFYKYVGGDGNQSAVDMVTDADGNMFMLGSSQNLGDTTEAKLGTQLYVVMTNAKGEVQWEKKYGDEDNEEPKDIEFLSSGELLVLGNRTKDKDIVVFILGKADGEKVKDPFINLTPGVEDYGTSITEISDGGFMITGYKQAGDVKTGIVYRFDNSFTQDPLKWNGSIGSYNDASTYDVVPMKVFEYSPETFYIFGYSNSPLSTGRAGGEYNYFIQPVNEGGVQKNGALVVPEPDAAFLTNEKLTSVKAVPDVNGTSFILVGSTSDLSGNNQALYVVKISPELVFAASPNDPGSFVSGRTVVKWADGQLGSNSTVYPTVNKGFLILCNASKSGDNNIYLTKLSEQLGNEWGDNGYRIFGGVGDDAAGAVAETGGGRITVLGTMGLGDLKGQHKIVIMNLNTFGMLGQ